MTMLWRLGIAACSTFALPLHPHHSPSNSFAAAEQHAIINADFDHLQLDINHHSRRYFLNSATHLDGASNSALRRELGKRKELHRQKRKDRQSAAKTQAIDDRDKTTDTAGAKSNRNHNNKNKNKREESKKEKKKRKQRMRQKEATLHVKTDVMNHSEVSSDSNASSRFTVGKAEKKQTPGSRGKTNKQPNAGKSSRFPSGKSGKHLRVSNGYYQLMFTF